MFYKLVFMKENDYFKLINQLCFLLFLVCCTFFQSKNFLIGITLVLLICTGYWIYTLITSPKSKHKSNLIILGLNILLLLMIALKNYDPSKFL